MIQLKDPNNRPVEALADASGALIVTVAGGPSGSASTVADGADVAQGSTTATAAPADGTGNYSVIAGIKRGLLNWATLLSRIPALVSGRMPVDGSGVTQPVSAAALPLPTGASTSANQTTANASLSNLDTKTPSQIDGRSPVDAFPTLVAANRVNAGTSSADVALATTTRKVRLIARFSDIRFSIGTGTQTANNTTSHLLPNGYDVVLGVPANARVGAIRDVNSSVNGILEISEMN